MAEQNKDLCWVLLRNGDARCQYCSDPIPMGGSYLEPAEPGTLVGTIRKGGDIKEAPTTE